MGETKMEKHDCCQQEEGSGANEGKSMKDYLVIGAIGLILVLAVVQAYQISAVKTELTGNTVATSTDSGSDGESYEEMMARMHPDQVKSSSSSSSSAMVGGC